MGKSSRMGMPILAPRKKSVYVDDIMMRGKKNNLKPVWDKLMTLVDLEEPTPL